jgi:hypothetical protein
MINEPKGSPFLAARMLAEIACFCTSATKAAVSGPA